MPPTELFSPDYTSKQLEVVRALADPKITFIINIGAYGSGKTWGSLRGYTDWAIDTGGRHIIASYQEQKVLDTLVPEMQMHLLEKGYESANRREVAEVPKEEALLFAQNANGIYLADGFFTFHHGETKNAWQSIVGMNTHGGFLDECLLLEKRFIEQVVTRCRLGNPKIVMCGNPQSKNHPFYANWWANSEIDHETVRITSMLEDNPHLSDKYIARQKSMKSGDEYRRDILGEWTDTAHEPIYAGRFEVGSPPDREPAVSWVSADYARVGINAAVLISDYGVDGQWVSDEWQFDASRVSDDSIMAIADSLTEWIGDRATTIGVDPTSNRDFKTELRRRGFRVIDSANDREEGTRVAVWYLESRAVRIAESCAMTIQSLQRAEYDPDQMENGKMVPLKRGPSRDHHADALRYFCATADLQRSAERKRYLQRVA